MIPKFYSFSGVTLLITHYNRSVSLANLLRVFKAHNCHFEDIVISDDGSTKEHLERIANLRAEHNFELITTCYNKGLGHNINKGQDVIKTPLTLYVQEDFEPTKEFADNFIIALDFFRERNDLDIIRFYAYYSYPYIRNSKRGFSEMYLPKLALNYTKIYYYSDHPHLRRSTFLEKFGRYAEGLKGDKTEYKMCISFLQKKGKGLFFNQYQSLFLQKNSEAEPSTMTRSKLKNSRNLMIKIVRDIYRQIKYNYDIVFLKP